MSEQDDELIEIFIEESKEHLEGIEDNLLTLEEQGENIDDDLINKVFRAIHSIKGAAGFFGLDATKTLAHTTENVLGKIRKRELIPTKQIVATLLQAVDVLNSMMGSPESMNEIDISLPMAGLEQILNEPAGTQAPAPKQSTEAAAPSPTVTDTAMQQAQVSPSTISSSETPLPSPATTSLLPKEKVANIPADALDIVNMKGEVIFRVGKSVLKKAIAESKGGNYVYLVEFSINDDIRARDKKTADILSELNQLVFIVEQNIDEAEQQNRANGYILLSTIMDPDLLSTFLELEIQKLKLLENRTFGAELISSAAPSAPVLSTPTAPMLSQAPEPPQHMETNEVPAANAASAPLKPVKSGNTKNKSEGSIRVNVKILDTLMTLAGEMVLTRNQLLQNLLNNDDEKKLQRAAQRVDTITTELQDAIMSTRMQSVGIVFNKFRRVVHDMSRDLGKEIDLELEGEEVELDKTIIEAIGDPLTHLVRNAIDHGIEMPKDRAASGKPAAGALRLSAFHKAGQVIIEVTDDGKGLDPNKIKEKAVAMGLYTPQELYAMPEQSILRLIFKPGFSTAKEVTEISGRGVGMDVVSSNLSNIGGVVDLESELGRGTTIRVKLPLTLAILPSLMVEVGGEHFAIPQMNLLELQRIPAAKVAHTIEKLGSVNVMRLRGELLPLIDLRDVLDIPKKEIIHPSTGEVLEDTRENVADRRDPKAQQKVVADQREAGERRSHPLSAVNIAVVSAGEFNYGIIVDTLLDSEEIVVKPLGRHLSDCRSYAGATVLGNGRAALILDVVGISQVMELMDTTETELRKRKNEEQNDNANTDRQSLLIVENAEDDVLAIPLGLVERVEKVPRYTIQNVAGRKTIKYRGGSLMLFSIEDVVQIDPICDKSENIFVVVSKIAGREAGIMCSAIVDTIDADITIDEITHRAPGVFGSAIIQDRITLLLDIHSIVTETVPNWIQKSERKLKPYQIDNIESRQDTAAGEEIVPQVLVVEDSKFFMNQIKATIENAGFHVLTAEDGIIALDVLKHNHVDLVLTDIEMPNLDGFGLVERMRADSAFASIPAIAVTSVMGEVAEARSREVGIDEYLIKLDRDQILDRSIHFLNHGRS
ncbi:MAG: chemotaxis protein CheW [Deltaproteobacteria bacterium]|nr:chemotaxis protein CheW [Deltaproteobacteria bacterium]MBN2674197.1 chemotaxis protein CheW [Deltaproteobacteria bacterium]